MSKKLDRSKNLARLKNDADLYDEFESESDRGHALLVAAALDIRLRERIAAFLIDDRKEVDELLGAEDKLQAPVRDFAARIRAAYCMGLITKWQRDNLDRIREIRNHFAHNLHGSTFDDEQIRNWCMSLTIEDPDPDVSDGSPRNRFTQVYSELALDFQYGPVLQPTKRCTVRQSTVWPDLYRVLTEVHSTAANNPESESTAQ